MATSGCRADVEPFICGGRGHQDGGRCDASNRMEPDPHPQRPEVAADAPPAGPAAAASIRPDRPPCADLLPEHLQQALQLALQNRGRRYRGRFAPSPTGALHRGNLRTALLSWLEARRHNGEWLLRFDDLDTPRNRAGAEQAILEDLRWLGLDWDGVPLYQSRRRGLYGSVLSALRRGGHLYPCRCSRRLLADVSAPHGSLNVYPGFCRQQPMHWGGRNGRLPSWRLRGGDGELLWSEGSALAGRLRASTAVGDVVLRRADGVIAYHLATAVDELWLGITEVVRGEDLWSSTGAQVAVMRLIGVDPPRYRHVPLWCDRSGRRLSKREAAEGLQGLREAGCDAAAVIGRLAASVGLVPAGSRLSAAELLASLPRPDPGSIPTAVAGTSL